MLGEPEKQALQIFLPPSYDRSETRYPVVYFLPGFGSSAAGEYDFFSAQELADQMASGKLKEMILVVPNGANVLQGSFFVNSPVTGNWEDFIVKDVVEYMDANYRTLPKPEGRGIGGYSMGGFGAINLAMRHPDLFSAVYLISAALFDEQGLQDSHMFNAPNKPRAFLETMAEIKQMPREPALHAMGSLEGAQGFAMAYGAAFAPHSQLGLPYFDYPYQLEGDQAVKLPAIWKTWQNGLGDWKEKIKQFQANLSGLKGIVIDYAAQDGYTWIPRGGEYLSKKLAAAGIPNQVYSYKGNHGDRLPERLMNIMLPFFNNVLADPE
jgi:pimeloyl-ACP methyl ester carboxylesterase